MRRLLLSLSAAAFAAAGYPFAARAQLASQATLGVGRESRPAANAAFDQPGRRLFRDMPCGPAVMIGAMMGGGVGWVWGSFTGALLFLPNPRRRNLTLACVGIGAIYGGIMAGRASDDC
jgi:hypothetical protein